MKKKILEVIYQSTSNAKAIQTTRFLIVGAGGIGSELLKSLSKSGAKFITILDYDRLEVINLNRGFMNGSEHAKKGVYKVDALQIEFKKLSPDVEIVTLPKNILDYDSTFVGTFDIVYCAVDSIKARRHLSKICIKADVPLFDGGVQEFFGQAKTQISGETECYGCSNGFFIENEPFPCSIRTIPHIDFHAVLWGKFILESIFQKIKSGKDEDVGVVFHECIDFKNEYGIKLFDFLFHKIIKELEGSSELQNLRSINFKEAQSSDEILRNNIGLNQNIILPSQKLFSLKEYSNNFLQNLHDLFAKYHNLTLTDYKNPLILDMITTLTNLRIYNFHVTSGLNYLSKFDIERTLLNITPVIASSASIIAGLLVTESMKYITNNKSQLTSIWLMHEVPDRLSPIENTKADPLCQICGPSQIYRSIKINSDQTLESFLKYNDLYSYLGKMQIVLENVIYDSDDDSEELICLYKVNLMMSLKSLAERVYNQNNIERFSLMINLLESEKTLNYEIEIENQTKESEN